MQTPRTLTTIRNGTITWTGALPAGRGQLPTGIPPLDLSLPVSLTGPDAVTWWIPQLTLLPVGDLEGLCHEPRPRLGAVASADEGYETGAWPHVDPDRWTFNGSPLRVVQADRIRLVPWMGDGSMLAEAGACTPVSMTSGYDFVRVRAVSDQLLLVHTRVAEEDSLAVIDTGEPGRHADSAAQIVLDSWYPAEIGFVPEHTEMDLTLPDAYVADAVAWIRGTATLLETNRLTVNGVEVPLEEEAR